MKDILYFREREKLGLSDASYNKDALIKRMGLLKSDHHIGFEPDYIGVSPVYCCKYSPSSNFRDVLALANEEGILAVQRTNLRNSSILVKQVHRNAVFDVAWMENEAKLTTVSGDQTAVLWDIKQSDICKIATFAGHTGSVKTTVFRPNQSDVFATGARDGKINIWDIRISHNCPSSKPDNCIDNAHGLLGNYDGPSTGKRKKNFTVVPNSIISMVFQDENTLITCGAVDGVIKAWDLRKNYAVYKRVPLPKCRLPEKGPGSPNGFTCLTLDPSNTRLFANCMDSSVYCFNVATFDSKPVSVYRGHSIHSFYVKSCLSMDGKYLLSGSSDGRAFIWDTTIAQKFPVALLEGHAGEVTSVTWNLSVEPEFVTCSDDMSYGVWRVIAGEDQSDVRCRLIWVSEDESQETMNSVEHKDDPWRSSGCSAGEKEAVSDHSTTPSTPHSIKNWVQEQTPSSSKSKDLDVFHRTPSSSGNKSISRIRHSSSRKGSKRRLEDLMEDEELAVDKDNDLHAEKRVLTSNVESSIKENVVHPLLRTPRDKLGIPSASGTPSPSILSISSPTEGLPNYVLDGISPHRHSCSSASKQKENVDWLTKLSKERQTKRKGDGHDETAYRGDSASKKKHRRQMSFESCSKHTSSGNLLKFFQTTVCDSVPD